MQSRDPADNSAQIIPSTQCSNAKFQKNNSDSFLVIETRWEWKQFISDRSSTSIPTSNFAKNGIGNWPFCCFVGIQYSTIQKYVCTAYALQIVWLSAAKCKNYVALFIYCALQTDCQV